MTNELNDLEKAYMEYILTLENRYANMNQDQRIAAKELHTLLEVSFKKHGITRARFQELSDMPRSESMMYHEVGVATYFTRAPQPHPGQPLKFDKYHLGKYIDEFKRDITPVVQSAGKAKIAYEIELTRVHNRSSKLVLW